MEQPVITESKSPFRRPAVEIAGVAGKHGVVAAWVNLGAGLAEIVASSTFGLLHDVRVETRERVAATLKWSEGMQLGLYRVAGRVNERVDLVADETLQRAQRAFLSALSGLTDTTLAASALATRTATTVLGGQINGAAD